MNLRGVTRSTSNSDWLTREGASPRTRGSRPAAVWRAFHSNHEFADRRRAKQTRIKVSVHVPLCARLTIGGPLMEARLNRGRGFEDSIDVRQTVALLRTQLRQAGRMTTRNDDGFKRPNRPERHDGCEMFVRASSIWRSAWLPRSQIQTFAPFSLA
jgi:hypothetical protein